jgi:two-component system response regulator TctD
MRVLLVEDNTELVALLKKGLAQGGFDADSVGTAADAAHVLVTMRYAAIVLDLGLPDEDGLSLLREIRRPGNLLGKRLTFGNVALDTEGRQVIVDGAVRPFPARETAVLEILLRRSGNVAPKRLFEDHLFGLSGDVGSNAVEVYVHRLRKMLADAGATVRIHTVRGVGYLIAEEKVG